MTKINLKINNIPVQAEPGSRHPDPNALLFKRRQQDGRLPRLHG